MSSRTIQRPRYSIAVAPQITSIAHGFFVGWKSPREDYQRQTKLRVAITGEVYASLAKPIRDTIEPGLLNILCELRRDGMNTEDVTTEKISLKVESILNSVKNEMLPDVDALIKAQLLWSYHDGM